MDNKNTLPTSEFLSRVVKANRSDRITIDELKISLHERGFGILLMIFALPVSVPIPYIPGITTFFALPLLLISLQMVLGFEFPWLPRWLSKISIKRRTVRFIILKSSPFLKRVEKLLRPRWYFLSSSEGARIIGFLAFVFTICIALPLPFTNFVPAIGIVVMALGLLSRDGITACIGMLIGITGVLFTLAVVVLGKKIVMGIINSFLY